MVEPILVYIVLTVVHERTIKEQLNGNFTTDCLTIRERKQKERKKQMRRINKNWNRTHPLFT